MKKIRRYIECNLAPGICNLECKYCYLIQQNRRAQRITEPPYPPEYIAKALSPVRLGGICFVSLSMAGETLIPDFMVQLTSELLKKGHIVNITSNGTLSGQFNKIIRFPKDDKERLLITFSLHYLELIRKNLLSEFWENVKKVKEGGCSICVKLNLYDDYIPYLAEIEQECIRYTGALPQLELTRNEMVSLKDRIYSKFDQRNYRKAGERFQSPLFEFTCDNFSQSRKQNFCYAGDWSLVVDLASGEARGCYCDLRRQNIFEDLSKRIRFEAIGENCAEPYCHNGQHFLAWGLIPELAIKPYGGLRERENAGWQRKKMQVYLNTRLYETNRAYSKIRKKIVTQKYRVVSRTKNKRTWKGFHIK